mgnify:FL=1
MDAAQARQTDWQAFAPNGCEQCYHTGYIGRVGIFQVVPVSLAMQSLIARNASAQELSQQAQQEGYLNLRQAGLRKVVAGISSLEEVMAATL